MNVGVVKGAVALVLVSSGCGPSPGDGPVDVAAIRRDVTAAVEAFHAADTARDAEAVVRLLWPEYRMLVDGTRFDYAEVARGAREFMAGLETFHTEWTDLEVTPLSADAALASFLFRDSIITRAGDTIRAQGPTTFVWARREGEWRLIFGDSDHYPIRP